MSIHKSVWVQCDGYLCEAQLSDRRVKTKREAAAMAKFNDWIIKNGEHYCTNCTPPHASSALGIKRKGEKS